MALSFPLSLASFADKIGVQSVEWKLQDSRELSGMGSGQVLQADLGPSLWTADITLRPWRTNAVREIEALINAVIRSKGSFYLYDPRKCVPASDPNATILGSSTVQINSLPDNKSLSLKGLPANYVITAGDYLSFNYGSSPTRRALHEAAETITANGSGVTAAFEVSPFIRTGAATDAAVTLQKAAGMFILVPGSLKVQMANAAFTVLSFSAVQKI